MLVLIICLSFSCTSSKVASLSDYISSEGTKDDEDQGQSFFAGGSEHRYTCTHDHVQYVHVHVHVHIVHVHVHIVHVQYVHVYLFIVFSGQMISGPPRKKKDLAKEVFEGAKK